MVESSRRGVLLEKATDWVLANGLLSLSLRPLAEALGTSARMLVYHFGSKDALVAAILDRVGAEWMRGLENALRGGEPLVDALDGLWRETLSDERYRALHALTLQAWAQGIATRDPAFAPLLRRVSVGWVEVFRQALQRRGTAPEQAERRALLIVAAVEGLLLHSVTDPDLPTDAAFRELLEWLRVMEV